MKRLPSLHIIYDVEGWAFSNAARALAKHAPPDFQVSMAPLAHERVIDVDGALPTHAPDILFVMLTRPHRPRMAHEAVRARGWDPALVGAWNAGWPLYMEFFEERYAQVDALLLNNAIAWNTIGPRARMHLCPNGVDLDIFRVTQPIERRRPRALWCGSEYWRHVKGYDDIVVPLGDRLAQMGVPSDFRLVNSFAADKRTAHEMAEWYNGGTVLICASETEGTPNTALEAAACGCVVVSTRVGNMPELIRNGENGLLAERSVDSLMEGIRQAIDRYEAMAGQLLLDIGNWSWQCRAPLFYEAFRSAMRPKSSR